MTKHPDNSKTILIVCRHVVDLQKLVTLPCQSNDRYLLASEDIMVHRMGESYQWIAEICWLERIESFYSVANDVIRICEAVNQWLSPLGNEHLGIPNVLLKWIRHCEGGMTTQRIQDCLMLIRSYLTLLNAHSVDKIIILRSPDYQWDDEVLIDTCRSLGIAVETHGLNRITVVRTKIGALFQKTARELYYLLYILLVKLRCSFRPQLPEAPLQEIVYQICNRSEYFLDAIVSLITALAKKGYCPVLLCWRASANAKRARENGFIAVDLESWVPLAAFWKVPLHWLYSWKRLLTVRGQFLINTDLNYQGVPLGNLLWPSVEHFFCVELPNSYRLYLAAQRYFKRHKPIAVKPWGGGVLPQGDIVLNCLKNENKPTIFNVMSCFPETPYDCMTRYIDWYILIGEAHRRITAKWGVPTDHVAVAGMGRYSAIPDFRSNNTPTRSRLALKIPTTFDLYILFDANDPLRGYLSRQEQAITTALMLDLAKRYRTVALLIKPHPGAKPGIIELLIDSAGLDNVYFIRADALPYNAINASDLLITKFSTIGMEAMLFEKPVISVLLDREENFKLYGNAAEYVFSLEELESLLTSILEDKAYRASWGLQQRKRHTAFLKEYYSIDVGMQQTGEAAADAVDYFIRQNQYLQDTITEQKTRMPNVSCG